MKRIVLLFRIMFFMLLLSFTAGHNFGNVFAFNIYQVGYDGGLKAPLERLYATLPAVKGNKTASATQFEITGGKSTLRIRPTEALFHASSDLKTSGTDPSSVIQLFKLEVSKNKRAFSLTPDNRISSAVVPVSFHAEDNLNFKIILFTTLGAGEYAFVDNTSSTGSGNVVVFAFGID